MNFIASVLLHTVWSFGVEFPGVEIPREAKRVMLLERVMGSAGKFSNPITLICRLLNISFTQSIRSGFDIKSNIWSDQSEWILTYSHALIGSSIGKHRTRTPITDESSRLLRVLRTGSQRGLQRVQLVGVIKSNGPTITRVRLLYITLGYDPVFERPFRVYEVHYNPKSNNSTQRLNYLSPSAICLRLVHHVESENRIRVWIRTLLKPWILRLQGTRMKQRITVFKRQTELKTRTICQSVCLCHARDAITKDQ